MKSLEPDEYRDEQAIPAITSLPPKKALHFLTHVSLDKHPDTHTHTHEPRHTSCHTYTQTHKHTHTSQDKHPETHTHTHIQTKTHAEDPEPPSHTAGQR